MNPIFFGIPICLGLYNFFSIHSYLIKIYSYFMIKKVNNGWFLPIYLNNKFVNVPIIKIEKDKTLYFDKLENEDDNLALEFILNYKIGIDKDMPIHFLKNLEEEIKPLNTLTS